MSVTRVIGAGLVLAAAGCVSPVDITTAYEDEVYLCDEPALYAERVAACRALRDAGDPCSGVFSFEGSLDGVPVVVDADLVEVNTASLRLPDDSLVRNGIDLFGDSPYFSFRLSVGSLGDPDTRADGDVTQDVRVSPPCEDGTRDDLVDVSMRVIAAGGSSDDKLVSGTLTMTRQTTEEYIGAFEGAFRDGSSLRGCFTVFTDQASVELLQPCD